MTMRNHATFYDNYNERLCILYIYRETRTREKRVLLNINN